MIKRIVKLTFHEVHLSSFVTQFENNKRAIRAFPGCQHLELWQDTKQKNIYFTYSYWNSEEDINAYRHSDLFKGIWSKTKTMFADKPEAWSVNALEVILD